jgi:hypothetical protein
MTKVLQIRASTFALDNALARVRLFQVAQVHGADAYAVRLAAEADANCPFTGLPRCSANNVLIMARERDRRFLGIPENATAR